MREHPGWKAPLRAIRDGVSFATAIKPIRNGALLALDAIQFAQPSVQIDALFLLATAMATVVGLDPHEMVTRARKTIPDSELFSDEAKAVRDYAKGELKK